MQQNMMKGRLQQSCRQGPAAGFGRALLRTPHARPSVQAGAATLERNQVQLSSNKTFKTPVQAQPQGDLAAYMREAPQYFPTLCRLPGGGALHPVDISKGLFDLTVPRIALFDMWIQPKSLASVRVEDLPGGAVKLVIKAEECRLEGSEHVERFRMNDRFELDVGITFTSQQQAVGMAGNINTQGRIEIKVDVPPPFNMMPPFILQSTANTAITATLSILLSSFANAMAEDYIRWAVQQQQQQQAKAAQNGHHSNAKASSDQHYSNGQSDSVAGPAQFQQVALKHAENGFSDSAAQPQEAAMKEQAAAWMSERNNFTSHMSD